MTLSWLAMIALAVFFAINMGCSGTGPSFASAYGAKILSHKRVALLFATFVIIGAYALGHRVVKTISKGLIPQETLSTQVILVILLAACIALVMANFLKVSQSTSQVTVFAIVGIGLFCGDLKASTFAVMLPMWLILPITSLIFAWLLGKFSYEKFLKTRKHEIVSKLFVVGTCCYVAFGIGSNNVANAAGPLVGGGVFNNLVAVLILAPCFGIGSLLIGGRVLRTMGKDIVNIDLTAASLICIVTGSLLVLASYIGIPQSLVQLNALAIIGFGLSRGRGHVDYRTIAKLIKIWVVAPIIALLISFSLISVITSF